MDTFPTPDPKLRDTPDATTRNLSIDLDGSGDPVRIHLDGELDMLTAPALIDALAQVRASGPRHLRFDMTELSFMDRAGLAAVAAAGRTAGGSEVSITGCREHVRLVFELTGHSDLIDGSASPSASGDPGAGNTSARHSDRGGGGRPG